MTPGTDRLTQQLAQAQLAEIAELERSIAAHRTVTDELERKLIDARRRYSETAARLNE